MSEARVQDHWRGLMHRWFVEYNPLYLVSAALVLVGVNLLSSALAEGPFLLAQLGIPLIAELYGWVLIGGAALLMRIGLRRPAVMLALLAALYQCDLTLHTETSVFLGAAGTAAAAVWWLSFVGKLFALAWAMGARLSRSALFIPIATAAGMVILPHYLRHLQAETASMLVGGWVFAVLAAASSTERSVTVDERLDAWGQTVLGRVVRATWAIWGTLFLGHVWFWCWDFDISGGVLFPVFLLLATRWVRREVSVWALGLGAVAFVATSMPAFTAFICLLASVSLALRALREAQHQAPSHPSPSTDPYRVAHADDGAAPRAVRSFGRATRAAQLRLFSGSVFGIYFAAWTHGWSGGSFPDHMLALDVTLTLVVVAAMWLLRRRLPLAVTALLTVHVHHGAALGILGFPKTSLTWAVVFITTGFAMLIALLALSYRWKRRCGDSC